MEPQVGGKVVRLGASCRKLAAAVLAAGLLMLPTAVPALALGKGGGAPSNTVTMTCGSATVTIPKDATGINMVCNPGSSSEMTWVLTGIAIGALVMWGLPRLRKAMGAGGAGGLDPNQAKMLNSGGRAFGQADRPKVRFDDVQGIDEAKAELQDLVEILRYPELYQELGVVPPKGVILYGGPGNGKTMLAKAVAGEANVPFFAINGAEFVQMFVGVGAARVRDLFAAAKKQKPSIIFIDEIDAIGRKRGGNMGGGSHDERESTLNQLLSEIDGFEEDTGVVVICSTNRVDVLDPALVRKGRIDWHIKVDKPDVRGRRAILGGHTKKMPLADDVDLELLARQTPGLSGADLAALAKEAGTLRARKYRLEHRAHFLQLPFRSPIGAGAPEQKNKAWFRRLQVPFRSPLVSDVTEQKDSPAPRRLQLPFRPLVEAKPELKPKIHIPFLPTARPKVTMEDFDEALSRVAMGPDRKSLILTEADKLRCARHEIGHATLGHLLDSTQDVAKVTLIPRGQSLGSAWFVDKEDRQLITRDELINRAAVALGGLVAERLYYNNDSSSGPSGDLQSVTSLMNTAVCLYGMGSEEFHQKYGYRLFADPQGQAGRIVSEETQHAVDAEVGALLNESFARAKKILLERRAAMDEACRVLMIPGQETMTGTEFAKVIDGYVDGPGPQALAA